VIRVDARAPFVRGRLVAQRRAPKVPTSDSPDLDPFYRVRGIDASLRWDLLQIVPAGLGNVLGYLGSVARASAMYRTYPESSLTLRALGRLSNPSEGPTYEPLISNGHGARALWGGCRTLPRGQPSNP
jgi:hypothetical protein